jgi:hypothetical protein
MRIRPRALVRRPFTKTSWRRPAVLVAASALLAVPALALVGPAQALNPAGVGPKDPGQHGFPAFYSDNAGTALQMCDDGSANCLGANDASLTPGDGENFYWMATGTLSAPGIDLSVEYALEAAWLTPTTPITFDRVRVRGDVDQAGEYTLTTPFGTTHTMIADDPAQQRNLNFTEDIGCGGSPCDFAAAAGPAHITDFLVNTTRPAGYLGNAATEGPATVGVGGPAASMSITGPSGNATSANFAVMGKLANPRAVSVPTAVDFGNVRGTRTKSVRLRNLGTEARTLGATTLTGSPAFRIASSTCTNARVLGIGQGCNVVVRYRPSRAKSAAANLRLRTDAGAHVVKVTAGSAAVASVRKEFRFKSVRAGAKGRTRRVVVTNRGSLPLKVRSVKVLGQNGRSFKIRPGAPRVCKRGTTVPSGAQCAVYLRFEPKSFGPKRAGLVIRTNGLPASNTVRLLGAGR